MNDVSDLFPDSKTVKDEKKTPERMGMKLFDYFNAMTLDKDFLDFNNEEVYSGYNSYIISHFISMPEMYVQLVNEINKYDLPKETHFRYFFASLPQRKQYFPWIKRKKESTDQWVEYIADYYQVGIKEAKQYLKLLDKEEIEEILEKYRYGKNKMIEV